MPGIDLVGAGFDRNGDPKTVLQDGLVSIRANFLSPGDAAAIDGL